jgi:hypothetical protein
MAPTLAPVSSSHTPRGAIIKREHSKSQRANFTASKGIFQLAAPVPADQRLMTHIFDSLLEHTSFPKLTDTDGKVDCLICFRSSLPPPNNQCYMPSCISTKHKRRSGDSRHLHIDLSTGPWRSKPEAYWKTVVDFLQIPGVDAILKPPAAFKQLTPNAAWS